VKNSYIGQAWLVILLSLVFGGGLAGLQVKLQGRIAANKLAETLGQIPQLVPGSVQGQKVTLAGRTVYRALDDQGAVGWVIPTSGQGFADRIEILLGVDAGATTITGVYVLDQKETPGLGNKIIEDEWRAQFAGKSALNPLAAITSGRAAGNQIDALTGATISSESVCLIVNTTLQRLRPELVAAAASAQPDTRE